MNEAKTNVPDIIFSCEEGTMSLLCIKSHTINIMIRGHKTTIWAIRPYFNSLNVAEGSMFNLSLILLISEIINVLVGIFIARIVANNDMMLSENIFINSLHPLLAK